MKERDISLYKGIFQNRNQIDYILVFYPFQATQEVKL